MAHNFRPILWFSEVDKDDIGLVGGKGANLGEMTHAKFPVPNGFVVTAQAYYEFIRENNLALKIKHLLTTANFQKVDTLTQVSQHIKAEIMRSTVSDELVTEIFKSYAKLGGVLKDALVAVRSSATAEDLPSASFAGQQDTYLNISGEANLLESIKEAWASLFTPRAMFYRHEQNFDHHKIGIAIVVQKMVASEKSGIMFTIDPVTNDKSKIVIEAIYGLGEMIVQGEATPDHYEVEKQDLVITNKQIQIQKEMLTKVGHINKKIVVKKTDQDKQKISDEHIQILADLGRRLEKHYYFPQDSEWAIEGNKVFIVQTRAITTTNNKPTEVRAVGPIIELKASDLILTGDPASPGIRTGPVRVLKSSKEIDKILKGEVLVAPQTNPDFVPAMKRAAAIVTDTGGRTSHAAIVSRELGIPAVVGTGKATSLLKTGQIVTVNGSKGEIYKGGVVGAVQKTEIIPTEHLKTATRVYVNLAEPEFSHAISKRHVDGVGLLRAEFMMAAIGTHPKKMIKDHRSTEFINKLAEGLEQFCRSFYPRPVVYRASDFKTNEYRGLIGGKEFEPVESNPMLGFRGAYRYVHDPKVFELELEAIKLIRNKKGLKNLWLMVPFVRTVKELIEVKSIIAASGLHRSPSFKLWMMVEIPSNVILLEKFIEAGIDGVSIGSNDLTMLILGTDRDNSEVAPEFDERNEAVLWALEKVIKTCHKYKITSSICGQAPSLYPDLLEKLVTWGVTSVSVSPDAIEHTRQTISHFEKELIK